MKNQLQLQKNHKTLLFKISFTIIFLFLIHSAFGQRVQIDKTINNQDVCNQFDITVSIVNISIPESQEVVILIDKSGSMANGTAPNRPIDFAKNAAIDFVNNLFLPANNPNGLNKIAIITFDGSAVIELALTENGAQAARNVINAIDITDANARTNTDDALVRANNLLINNGTFDCITNRSIIILTDGTPTSFNTGTCFPLDDPNTLCVTNAIASGIAAQTTALNNNIYNQKIFTIGLLGEIDGAAETVAISTLNQIQNAGAFFTEDNTELLGFFDQILTQLVNTVTQLPGEPIVTDDIQDGFTLVGNITTDNGTVSVNGQTIFWNLDSVTDDTVNMSYTIASDNANFCGNTPVGSTTTTYRNSSCNIEQPTLVIENTVVCIPCPETIPTIERTGCDTIDYLSGLDPGECPPISETFAWQFLINGIPIPNGNSNTASGTFTFPAGTVLEGDFTARLIYTGEYSVECPSKVVENTTNTIILPLNLSATITSQTETDCPNNNIGEIAVTATNGTPPYSYSIDGGNSSQNSGLFSNLAVGNYNVDVTDRFGCTTRVENITVSSIDKTSPVISTPARLDIEGCDENDITTINSKYPFSATPSSDIKDTFIDTQNGYSASDDVSIASITYVDLINPNFSCFLEVLRSYSITDICGNVGTTQQTIIVTNAAAIVLPENRTNTVNCISEATETFALPTVTDACGNNLTNPTLVVTDSPNPLTCEGNRTYSYTYTDCTNKTVVWTYTYIIDLIISPLVPNSTETEVQCIADATQPTAPTVTDVCGNDLTPIITENIDPACEGDKIYTFTYTDCAGNESVYTFTYTINIINSPIVPDNVVTEVQCSADATQPTAPTVTDVCGNDLTPIIAENIDPACEGDKIYTFTYTDCAGNESVYTFTYTINIINSPIVPDNMVTEVQCSADATQPAAPNVTDVCGNDLTPIITENIDPVCEGDKTYTFTYTDCAGNISTYVFTYTIKTNTAPTIPENTGTTVECITDATQPAAPNVTDVCGNDLTPIITENIDPACEGDKTYTFTYTDCAGNISTYVFTYTIKTNTAPTIPENTGTTVECITDATQPTAPTVTDVCGNDLTPIITENIDPACEGDKTYTFTYTDCAGNISTYVFTYTINLSPFILPSNAVETVDNLDEAVEPIPPVVTDNCSNIIIPSSPTKTETPRCEGSIIYTFEYTDCANNTANWTYTYVIELAPFTLPNNGGATIECIDEATIPTPPTIIDANGDPVIPVMSENEDPTCEGEKIYTFTYTDCANNTGVWLFIYTIDITNAPVVPLNAGADIDCIADATQPSAPSVTDVCGNTLTPVITQSTDPTCKGDKIYTFTYTDCAGNEAIYTFTYTINLTTPPTTPSNTGATIECVDDAVQPVAPSVTDACGNNLIPVITENMTPVCEGDKIYTFTYTDCVGNISVYVFTYIIRDTIAPVLVLPPKQTAECSDDLSTTTLGIATATDNCDDNPTVTFNDVITDGICTNNYTITRTWTATDVCGNITSADQLIDVLDTTAPEFDQTTLPANTVVECDAIPNEVALTATDNCGTTTVMVQDLRVDGNCSGNYVINRSYIAEDECGNTNTHIQIITVQDTTAPLFVGSLPNNQIVRECDAIPDAEVLTATDACGTATVSVNDVKTDGICENSYNITRTWTATDECGVTATHTQIIMVRDTTPPVFIGTLPGPITVECDDIPNPTAIRATDNCGSATVTFNDIRTNGNCPSNYILQRVWTATDACGLETSHTQIITVQDTTAPVPSTSFETTLDVSCSDIPIIPALEFTDNCSSNVIVDFTETNTFDETVIADYQIIRTWIAKDECDNEGIYKQTLNVTLDEIISEVNARDICFANGTVDLSTFLASNVFGGFWEIIEGNTAATIDGNIFDPSNLEDVYSETFNPNTDGIPYRIRYTGFQSGCLSTTDVIMVVDAGCKVLPCGETAISISTAITPNGDNVNDTFDIEGISLCGFITQVKIFNRWGAIVFESNNYTLGSEREGNAFGSSGKWDGSAPKSSIGNNKKLPNGTYYYIIKLNGSGLDPLTGPIYLGTK